MSDFQKQSEREDVRVDYPRPQRIKAISHLFDNCLSHPHPAPMKNAWTIWRAIKRLPPFCENISFYVPCKHSHFMLGNWLLFCD